MLWPAMSLFFNASKAGVEGCKYNVHTVSVPGLSLIWIHFFYLTRAQEARTQTWHENQSGAGLSVVRLASVGRQSAVGCSVRCSGHVSFLSILILALVVFTGTSPLTIWTGNKYPPFLPCGLKYHTSLIQTQIQGKGQCQGNCRIKRSALVQGAVDKKQEAKRQLANTTVLLTLQTLLPPKIEES